MFIILLIAAATDLKSHRVRNRLIVVGFISGLMFRLGENGASGLLTFLGCSILPVIIFFLFYAARIIGAGDIKLFSVISSYMGVAVCFKVACYAFVVAAAWGGAKLLLRGCLVYRISVFFNYISKTMQAGQILPYPSDDSVILPLSVCIFAGMLIWYAVG